MVPKSHHPRNRAEDLVTGRMHIVLVPGLFSPRWMLRPMGAYLRREFDRVTVWDHPRPFAKLDVNRDALAEMLRGVDSDRSIAIVAHSFGDWVVRDLMDGARRSRVSHLVSLAPVVTSNRLSVFARSVIGDVLPEIGVMGDPLRAAQKRHIAVGIRHLVIWPRIDPWIRRGTYDADHSLELRVWATHNSCTMQPNVMRTVSQFLKSETAPRPTIKPRAVDPYPIFATSATARVFSSARVTAAARMRGDVVEQAVS